MAVTALSPGRDERWSQVERLVQSGNLRGSESLCRLLRYLATQALDHPGIPVREHQIASEVFGRPETFDPRLDSTVRVQAGRLRTRLAEYYAGPGAGDPVIIELPKGAYQIVFQSRDGGTAPPPAAAPVAGQLRSLPQTGTPARPNRRWFGLAILVAAPMVILAFLLFARPGPQSSETLRRFWADLTSDTGAVAVVFGSAPGMGDVRVMHQLDRLFAGLRRELRIETAAPVGANAILVGTGTDKLRDFQVRGTPGAIVNAHPRSGEPAAWTDTPGADAYAVVALEPAAASRWVIILAGTTPIGTEAAAEYVASTQGAGDLLEKISGSRTGIVRPFEAVVHTAMRAGAPGDTTVAAVHLMDK